MWQNLQQEASTWMRSSVSDRKELFAEMINDKVLDTELLIGELDEMGYFTAPASTKYHGNYEGGLFDHSYAVARCLELMTDQMGLVWQDERSPWIVGLFHDLC